jgi:nucleoid-associated protein YgaU
MLDIAAGAAAAGAGAGAGALASQLGAKLQKAKLKVVEGDPKTTELNFMYNPTEFTTSKDANWNRPVTNGAKNATKPQYTGPGAQKVSMEIFFDAWEDQGDVSTSVKTLFEWVKPTKNSHDKGVPQPPVLAFQWGSNKVLSDFKGFLKSVSAKYTLFRSDGVPLRATASISLEEIPPPEEKQNPTSGSLNSRKSHLVGDGDTLHSIAYAQYGDAGFWRSLAIFNGIDDPLRVRPGQRVLIPSTTEAADLASGGAGA